MQPNNKAKLNRVCFGLLENKIFVVAVSFFVQHAVVLLTAEEILADVLGYSVDGTFENQSVIYDFQNNYVITEPWVNRTRFFRSSYIPEETSDPEHGSVTVIDEPNKKGYAITALLEENGEPTDSYISGYSAVDNDGLHVSLISDIKTNFTGDTNHVYLVASADAGYSFRYFAENINQTTFAFHLDGTISGYANIEGQYFEESGIYKEGYSEGSWVYIDFGHAYRRGVTLGNFHQEIEYYSEDFEGDINDDFLFTVDVYPNTWNTFSLRMGMGIGAGGITTDNISLIANFKNTLTLTSITGDNPQGKIIGETGFLFSERLGISTMDYQEGGNPVPEPATILLFGTGLAGLGAVRRRKKVC